MRKLQNKQILREHGFTLVELLVVVAVISILATITVMGFGNWRKTVAETEVKNDLNGAISVMENYKNFNGAYPTAKIPDTKESSSYVNLRWVSGDQKSYCMEAKSKAIDSVFYHVVSTNGRKIEAGGC